LGVPMPRNRGHNTVEAIGAMLDGKAQAFIALGGNFLRATPDSPLIIKAFEKQKLPVNIATKLNHSHLVPGETSFILPCLGRTEIDRNSQGKPQIVTVEDSMSMVHGSGGINELASPELRSEIAIVAGIAHATLGNERVQWNELADDYDLIRDMISRVLPGFQDFNERVRVPRG
ncbi:CbbBc protein, partial [Neisseria gonorrhoeae]